ncbi:MAG TPA: hypothetical protein VKU19_32165 [Bryobacteraceae bacterium]|nr:hypothetical protein [Bryobacteraceae bacterium]
MANFQQLGRDISGQRVNVSKLTPLTVELYGPLNTYASPSQELEVVATPASNVKIERSLLPIANSVRKWQITGRASGPVRIEAKAWGKTETWSWFELNVEPGFYKFLTAEKKKFIEDLAREGRAKAKEYGYPLSAMLACACSESGYGTSDIYLKTNCPFNLQRPAAWTYPKCELLAADTKGKFGSDDAQPATFCVAKSLSDAARLWCEWIAYYPGPDGRQTLNGGNSGLMGFRGNPRAFATNLYRVAFADSQSSETAKYGDRWDQCELSRFD